MPGWHLLECVCDLEVSFRVFEALWKQEFFCPWSRTVSAYVYSVLSKLHDNILNLKPSINSELKFGILKRGELQERVALFHV